MPRQPKKGQLAGRIRLDGEEALERPELTVHVVGDDDVLARVDVSPEGDFVLDEELIDKAHRIVVTAKGGDPADPSAYMIRPTTLRRAVELGELALPDLVWTKFLPRRRCIDATLRRCFPWHFLIEDLVAEVRRLPTPMLPVASKLVRPWFFRCAPICEGTVEVFRRRCCCFPFRPPVIVDEPPFELPIPIPEPDPFLPITFPPVPPGPGPGPDPAPFALQDTVLTEGAIDSAKLARLRLELDRPGIRPELIWPPRLCSCGPPVKVADGFVGEGGAIHVCWWEPLWLHPVNCYDEYAFVVKQSIAGSTVTIYNGVAAGQWFDEGEEIHLTSYHPKAIGCREEEFPVDVDGAFVVLQDIGTTESHQLRTPLPDGPDSVASPSAGSGLLDFGAGPNYACGGDLQLRYHFSEIVGHSMKALGARYYRVQWAPADSAGDPDGDWETLPVPAWQTWRVDGSDIVPGSHSLGPVPAGTHSDLFHIPFETGGLLVPTEEWQDGQFHAVVPTASKPEGRYLVRIEVFDGAGNRLEPATSAFTYRRWNTPTTTLPVTHGALTHMIRTDNRPVVADIVDILGPGAGAGDCKFFTGGLGDAVTIQYRAYHPEGGSPSFMLAYSLSIHRGVSGSLATPVLNSTVEIGEGGPPAGHAVTIGDLLDGEDRCSFAVQLYVSARIHNGSGRLSYLDRSDIAAFAVLTS
jgi:hypothetical protein